MDEKRFHEDDLNAMRGPFIEIKTPEMFEAFAKAAQTARGLFDNSVESMTLAQAKFVRKLRVEDGCTWRAVAGICNDQKWENLGDWYPDGNQLMGMALCEKAASFFGEKYMEEPWN